LVRARNYGQTLAEVQFQTYLWAFRLNNPQGEQDVLRAPDQSAVIKEPDV
jgi:hypothetical protein